MFGSRSVSPQRRAACAALSAFAAVLTTACGTTASGGGGYYLVCNDQLPCPATMQCVQNICQLAASDTTTTGADATSENDAAGGNDVQAGTDASMENDVTGNPDTGSEQDTPIGKDTTTPSDVPTVTDTTVQPDVPTQLDTAGQQDAKTGDMADGGLTAQTTIAALQKSSTSLVCGTTDGISSHGQVSIEASVVTGPVVVTSAGGGKKLQTFHVRPASGPISPTYAGLTVVVQSSTLTLDPGDVIDLKGEYQEYYCMTELFATDATAVQVVGKQGAPVPYDVAWSSLAPDTIEALEGVLIRVPSAKVVDPAVLGSDGKPHGEAMLLATGGVSLAISFPQGSAWVSADQKTTLTAGESVSSVTGHLQYSFGKYLLRLRGDADFVP